MTEQQALQELGVVPESKDVFGKRAKSFDALVDAITAAQAEKKQAEMEIKTLQTKLESLFADSDSKTILSAGRRVTLVLSSNSHLDRKALLESGVPADVIVRCTKQTQYTFVKVTAAKEAK